MPLMCLHEGAHVVMHSSEHGPKQLIGFVQNVSLGTVYLADLADLAQHVHNCDTGHCIVHPAQPPLAVPLAVPFTVQLAVPCRARCPEKTELRLKRSPAARDLQRTLKQV